MNAWTHIILGGIVATIGAVWGGYGWYLKTEEGKLEKMSEIKIKDHKTDLKVEDSEQAIGIEVSGNATLQNTEVKVDAKNTKSVIGAKFNSGLTGMVVTCPITQKPVPLAFSGQVPAVYDCPHCHQSHSLSTK